MFDVILLVTLTLALPVFPFATINLLHVVFTAAALSKTLVRGLKSNVSPIIFESTKHQSSAVSGLPISASFTLLPFI